MYSVHSLKPNYEHVLDRLLSTKTNSIKTSSLPLADFWRPERIKSQEIKELCEKISIKFEDLDPTKADYCFEYPTPASDKENPEKNIEYSRPSMTDLMIFLKDIKETRITIEAKYTEYIEDKKYSPLLGDWYEEEKTHKKKILDRWINYIGSCSKIPSVDDLFKNDNWRELPYQFLHRTASACFNCKHPILVYQLFYDEEYREEMKKFEGDLNTCATKMLHLDKDKLLFFIIETKVLPDSPAFKEHEGIKNPSDLFIYMKEKEQYTFGKKITVRDGYTLTEL